MAKIVFFGTPEYVIPILDLLSREHKIVAVVTQKPKPVGRKQFREFSAVDTWAYKRKIPVYFECAKIVEENIKADLGVVAAYGQIIPKRVLNHFPKGILNIHPSILPNWRGASPVQAAMLSGKKSTGVTVIQLDEELDHGPIISSFTEEILADDTATSLRLRLFNRSAQFLVDLIPSYLTGKVPLKTQNHKKATYTKTLVKEDGFLPPNYLRAALIGKSLKYKWQVNFTPDLSLPVSVESIQKFVRAMEPWPGVWTYIQITNNKKRLKILEAHLESVSGVGRLIPDRVQLEGKNATTWEQFNEGYPQSHF